MSAGLSTTITITFTPQLNQDINSFFPILSETGLIKIPLICTCKKALISVEDSNIDFGHVIFGEQQTRHLKLKNSGALPTKIFIKTNEGKPIPFFSMEDLRKREEQQQQYQEALKNREHAMIEAAIKREKDEAEKAAKAEAEGEEEKKEEEEGSAERQETEINERDDLEAQFGSIASLTMEEIQFEEFLAQVSFKRTTNIEGYSEIKIQLVFVPYKLTTIDQEFTLFFEN